MNMSIRFPHLGIDLGYVGKTVSVLDLSSRYMESL